MSNKLWGGRFKKEMDKDFEVFSKSISYDYKLAEYDIYHSLIHINVLNQDNIITNEEEKKMSSALNEILEEVKAGKFKFDPDSEDIHTNIQNIIEKKIGELAYKLHTFRSRNEQIVFDEKFYCLREAKAISTLIKQVIVSLNYLSSKYKNIFIPGYTHTQRAQVISFNDYLGAFSSMLRRDFIRINHFLNDTSVYLKSGALAGSPLNLNSYVKAIKEFIKKYRIKNIKIEPAPNSLDNVASRDFIINLLSIISIIQMHLSRLSEDFILYSTKEFSFFNLPDEFCTGSSLMPHKKNPDFLELTRGYTGKIYGNLMFLLTTMKGLSLTYDRDIQLDKEALFPSIELVENELKIMVKLIKKVKLNKKAIDNALKDESLYATELAELLVYNGTAFKEAHNIVGRLIRYSEDNNIRIKDLPEDVLKTFHKSLSPESIGKVMNPQYSISSKKVIGKSKGRQSKYLRQ